MEWLTQDTHVKPRVGMIVAVGTSARGILRTLHLLLQGSGDIERLGVLGVDSDATQSYPHLAAPLVPRNGGEWGPNTFVPTPLPDEDVVASILCGERPGQYDHVPPAIFRTLRGNGMVGVGGLVPLAEACTVLNEDHLRGVVRQLFNRVTDHRTELHDHADAPLVVYELAGCLGGTWGELDRIHDLIVEEAGRLDVAVAFQRLMIYPGAHPSKDMPGSMANAAAWTKEFAARATGRYVRLRLDRDGGRPVRHPAPIVPTWIVSDMNNAPGTTSTVETAALFAAIAHWLRLLTATPLGARLEAALADFEDDALAVDPRGERRVARSFGLSVVSLDRERIARFAVQRLVRSSLQQLHGPVEAEAVEEELRQFVRDHQLREGAGFSDLSRALRVLGPTGREGIDQTARFRSLFDEHLGPLDGMALLRAAPDIFHVTVAQTRDAADRIQEARRGLVERVAQEIDRRIQRWGWDPERGVAYVQTWLQEAKSTFEGMAQLASEDRRRHDEQVARLQATVQRLEGDAMPRFLAMGPMRGWFNRRHIQELAERYVRDAKALEVARKEELTREAAIRAFQEIGEILADHHDRVTRLMHELAAAIAAATTEEDRIRQWDGTLVTPKGMALDDDLDGLYRQLLARPDDEAQPDEAVERRAARELLLTLQRRGELLELAREDGRLVAEMEAIALERLRPPVLALHVQTELLRRYPADSEVLQSFLRQRDREAHEMVTLKGSADYDNPVHVLRFLCGDNRRAHELQRALNHAAYPRAQGNALFECIDTGDPEQLALVQVRLSFPPSQIGIYAACHEAYVQRSRGLAHERMHTELVGRFLPEPGVPTTELEAQVALVKAFATDSLESGVGNGAGPLVYRGSLGEREPIDDELRAFRRFDLRVEVITHFYCDWREHGPEPLRRRMLLLGALQAGDVPEASALSRQVAALVGSAALQQVLDELAWYDRNTVPQATWWGRRQP